MLSANKVYLIKYLICMFVITLTRPWKEYHGKVHFIQGIVGFTYHFSCFGSKGLRMLVKTTAMKPFERAPTIRVAEITFEFNQIQYTLSLSLKSNNFKRSTLKIKKNRRKREKREKMENLRIFSYLWQVSCSVHIKGLSNTKSNWNAFYLN